MNRSILIVICDFLLVSLLVFSSPDLNRLAEEQTPATTKSEAAARPSDNGSRDLAAALQLALDEERKNRAQLENQLSQIQQQTGDKLKLADQQLQTREEENERLQREQARLQRQFAEAQTNLQLMNAKWQSASAEAVLTKERLDAMSAEAHHQSDQATSLQQQVSQLSKSNQAVSAENVHLSTQIQVVQAEKLSAVQQAALMSAQVQAERQEKAQLAEGVKALASNSSQLAEEIHQNQALAPNSIFSDFVSNRVEVRFSGSKSGLFGSSKNKNAFMVLVTDSTNTFAICHVQDTPFTLSVPGAEWQALSGGLDHGGEQVGVQSLSFSWPDPRLVWIPINAEQKRQLGCKAYRISSDPFKFQDAVLVGAPEGYYGECRFEIDLTTPNYLKLNRNVIKGLFGKFNPSRGDLVFSKSGELLGVMANNTYCMMLRSFEAGATFQFGGNVRDQHTGEILSQLSGQVNQLPFKLQ